MAYPGVDWWKRARQPKPPGRPVRQWPLPPGMVPGGRPGYGGPPSMTIPGFRPDYETILKGDAGYQGLLTDLGTEHGLSVEDRASKFRRRLIEFGLLPEGMGLEDIDPSTRALIEQSTASGVSEVARSDKAHAQSLRSIRNTLAARGIFTGREEGGVRAESGRENARFGTERFDSTKEIMEYLDGVSDAYAASEADRNRRQEEGAKGAWDRGIALPGNEERADITMSHVAGTNGYYKGTDGRIYDQQKQPVNVAAAKAHYSKMVADARRRGVPVKNTWFFRRLQALGG